MRRETIAIKLCKNRIIEDMSDELECSPRPDMDNAYSVALMQTIGEESGKRKKARFNRSKFKEDVLNFYGASRTIDGDKETFCHLLGWRLAPEVSAAHLVPKSLNEDSFEHLFGRELKPATDPRNCMLQI